MNFLVSIACATSSIRLIRLWWWSRSICRMQIQNF